MGPVIRETSIMKLAIVVCLAAYVTADATADADADPALLYSTYGAHALASYALPHTTYGYGVHPYTYGSYARGPRYYANSGGAVHIVKRDAEADAEPAADADADAALYGYTYGGYHPYAYSAYRHPYAYSGYRYPYYSHYGKRSADAEPVAEATADAALYGYTYGTYHPYAYSAYSSYNRYPYGYSAYPYYHHFGKRSAEAEPHRGYYGYGGYYGYSRPHYGYGRYHYRG